MDRRREGRKAVEAGGREGRWSRRDFGRAAPARGRAVAAMLARSEGGAVQIKVREVILGLVGERGGHGDLDPAHAPPHLGADLQELEPDRAAGGAGELGVAPTDPPERFEQHVGKGREPQAQLIGAHGRG